jgi:uncharacterized protein YbjT (DUF2867 family)
LSDPPKKIALIAGATGLVGARCVARLLAHPAYDRVTVLSRRPLALSHAKLRVELVDFEGLKMSGEDCDDIFCCLGTTIKRAGSRENFRRVDHDFPAALANLGKAAGAQQFLMVSALGADAGSMVFYSRVKGETERDVAAIGLRKTIFMRPSLLLGERGEQRPGERMGIFVGRLIAPLLRGHLRKYRPIQADDVAAAMLYAANHEVSSGPVESDEIARLAELENAQTMKKAGWRRPF